MATAATTRKKRRLRRREKRTLRMLAVLCAVSVVLVARVAQAFVFGVVGQTRQAGQDDAQSQAAAVEEPQEDTSAPTSDNPERDAFVSEWTSRIDAYNAGYPLEGYGYAFAEAAYDNNVDPRLAPAIARLESGSGQVCFMPYNAWGWGSASWSDWDTAIREYIAGFAASYGYDLSYEAAMVYAPEEYDEWYPMLLDCMEQI